MKKLHVIAMADRREELLKGLLHLGCVEISEPREVLADPQWASLFQRSGSSLAERKGQLTDVNTALDAIKQYAKLKDGMFIKRHPITEAEFLDAGAAEKAQAACDAVREQLGILTKAQSEAGRLESRAAALKPWESLDLPLERSGTAHTIFRLGVCPGQTDVGAIRVQMEAEGLAAELYEISADKLQKYLLVIVHRGDEEKTQELLRPFGFSAVTFQGMTGTAAENIRSLERELEANKKTQDDAAAAIAASAENRDALRIYADRLRAEAAKEQCAESVLTDETVLYFQGWVPAEQEKAVGTFLTEKGCAWETLDPTEEEIQAALRQIPQNCDSIVLCTYNMHLKPGQQKLLNALTARALPMTVVAMRNPYDLKGLPAGGTGIEAWDYSMETLELLVELFQKKWNPTGVLPIEL